MSAQSWLSVPPAPEEMFTIASLPSSSPVRGFRQQQLFEALCQNREICFQGLNARF
jgi:hypothetical protein